MYIGIKSYSIHSSAEELPKNQITNQFTVNFVILGKLLEPKDYQLILDEIQATCEKINLSNPSENALSP